jgi:spore coat protein A, manganese oxidase
MDPNDDRDFLDIAEERFTRRNLLHGGAGVALLCALPRATRSASTERTAAWVRAQRQRRIGPFQRDLPIPPVLEPVSTAGGVDRYEVTMRPGQAQILDGEPTDILGYEGIFPGPTIKTRVGRPAHVLQRNELGTGRDAVVHLHGGITEPGSDGHPEDVIPAGGEHLYTYANRQRAATLMYHEHVHHHTAEGIYRGLIGSYMIEDPSEDRLDLPSGRFDVPVMIADRDFDESNQLIYPATPPLDPLPGRTLVVNGAVSPRMRTERRLYRLRLINLSNGRTFELALSNGAQMIQISSDTGLLPRPYPRKVVSICPGERAEVVVDFRNVAPGRQVVLENRALVPGDPPAVGQVLRFDVVRGGKERARVPKRLRDPYLLPSVAAERSFALTLRTGGGQPPAWQINGESFDPERIDIRPRLGTSEIWHWVNESPVMHPMHSHLAHFQVISVGGRKPHPADSGFGFKDTVPVPGNTTATVRMYFTGYTGRYVYHCHAAEHSDHEMMAQMEVTT